LDKSLTFSKIACNVRCQGFDLLFFMRPVRESGKDMLCMEPLQRGDVLLGVIEDLVHLVGYVNPFGREVNVELEMVRGDETL